MSKVFDIAKKICGHEYRIEYKHERYEDVNCWVSGEVVNFCSRGITVYNEEKGFYTVPHSAIRWMLPIPEEEKLNKEKTTDDNIRNDERSC